MDTKEGSRDTPMIIFMTNFEEGQMVEPKSAPKQRGKGREASRPDMNSRNVNLSSRYEGALQDILHNLKVIIKYPQKKLPVILGLYIEVCGSIRMFAIIYYL